MKRSPLSPTEKKTIVYIASHLPPKQVPEADHALHQCMHLAQHGHDVHIISTNAPEHPPEGVTIHAVIHDWSWRDANTIRKLIHTIKPDMLIIFFLGILFNYSKLVTLLPAYVKLTRPRTVVITQFSNLGSGAPHDGSWRSKLQRSIFQRLGRYRYGSLLSHSDQIIALSHLHIEKLKQIDARLAPKLLLIPPPPLLPMNPNPAAARTQTRQQLGINQDAQVIAHFGRLYPQRGIEALITGFARVARERPDVHLLIIGGALGVTQFWWTTRTNYQQELENLIASLNLTERVTLTGEYEWDSFEGSAFLYASDMVVLPRDGGIYLYNSSFAAVCAHGLPVIATQSNDPALLHGQTIFQMTDATPGVIAASITTVLQDSVLKQRLTEGASLLAETWFSWEKATQQLLVYL